MDQKWVDAEFKTLKLGHKAIDKRAVKILNAMGNQPGASIPQAFTTRGEMKACYRFFDNDLVTADKILSTHHSATLERIKQHDTILILSDTTSFNYSTKKNIKGLGEMTHSSNKGLWGHCSIAVTPERLTLGLTHSKIWARGESKNEMTNHQVYALPLKEKELYRWIESYLGACEIAKKNPETKVINICDREVDFAEFFEEVNKQQRNEHYADVIVRATYDRSIIEKGDEGQEKKKLFLTLKNKPSLGEIGFTIPENKEHKSREVVQVIKSTTISFKKRYIPKANSPFVTVNAVLAIEKNPPEGYEPIVWILLTTLPVNNLQEALKIIKYYLNRWEIEMFFKVLKSGCKVEERQLRDVSRLEPLMCMLMIIAWRVMYIQMMGRIAPEHECTILFEECEWKAAWQIYNRGKRLPENAPKLKEMIEIIGTFGGYVINKKGKPPGVKAMWIGLQRLRDFATAWEIYQECR